MKMPLIESGLKTTGIKKEGAEAPGAPDIPNAFPGFSPILFHGCWLQPTEKSKKPCHI
jgi:hypothetical protein